MKKLFNLVFTAVFMLLAVTSCSQEEDFTQSSQQTTSFNISLNGAVGSRAIGKGTYANKLFYEVFLDGASVEKGDVDFTSRLELPLLNGETYDIVFWAQSSDCSIYNLNDLREIKVKYTDGVSANQESYDAFFNALVEFEADGETHRVELRRPFAQLNLGTGDWGKVIVPSGAAPVTETSVTVEGLANTFAPLTGLATGSVNATFDYSELPTGTFEVNSTDYQYLSLNYLLVPGKKDPQGTLPYVEQTNADKATVNLTFNLKRGNTGLKPISVPNVPLQRNWRTNIIGDVLTGTDFDIVIVPGTDNDHNVEISKVGNVTEIQKAIDNAKDDGTPTYLEVTNDMTFGNPEGRSLSRANASEDCFISIPAGVNVVLDLKGFTISGTETSTGSFSLIKNQGTLTITNSNVEKAGKLEFVATNNRGWDAYSSVISNNPGGKLIVNSGVTIEHLGGTDMAYGIDNLTNGKGTSAITTINGATVKSTYRAIRQFLNGVEATNELYVNSGTIESTGDPRNKSIWMQDPSKNANTGKLVVEADANLVGDVYLSVTEGSTEWPVEVSIAAAALKDGATVLSNDNVPYDYKVVEQDGVWTVQLKDAVAKIGENGFTTLQKAVNAVKDGETITLIADEIFTEKNYYDNGGYKDGIGYSGDKSFTIDLNGKKISQDGALNDYLIWIKNVGSKENVITIKNGTLDAGTTAYCALCTASSHENQLTVNLEDVTLVNNISNGSTVKIRAGSVLNVNAGTKITGKDSYLGIENWNATVNIYDGAEIYMNGTSSYNGCLVGVGGNGTINVYGGYGKGVSGGLIAMTSGGTINVSGGEWIANTDGTFANSNKSVLIAQSDKQYNAGAGNAVVNVTGGTFKGGYNCYGNAVGDAQINIKGGNFNADPKSYVVAGYEATEVTGIYTVAKPQALADLEAAIENGGNVTLTNDVTLIESIEIENRKVVLDLNGKTITAPLFSAFEVKAGGELTIKNGKVVAYESTVRAIGGKATIESGEYTSTGTALDSPATYRYSLDCREGGELVINGGTFKSNNGMINVGSTVTINGGKFENIVEKTMTRHFAYVSAPLTINDGEFYYKANASAGGRLFCGAAAGGDIQVNGGKFTSLFTSGSVNRIFESYYGGTITVTGGLFNTNGGIANFVVANTDEATKAAYPYVAK